ncbi:hypothetical protein EGW08_007326 [Elysia chlorotica]|uniref:Arginase n=1 Tax=Elysia chlorotica TaxID=188477 RepID=A0A3S1C7C7_ELYCH|nr:hypothetical protein EGW08_007326 [Elysia chlorotica]
MTGKTVGVLGFPFSKGQPKGGTELAPKELRAAGIVDRIQALGNNVIDHGDVDLSGLPADSKVGVAKNSLAVGEANKKLSEDVAKYLKKGEQVLLLGGDHSLGIGSLHGHTQVQPDTVVVWVDAHADLNTPFTSDSKNMHGMPLAYVVKEMAQFLPKTPGLEWCKPSLSTKDIVYIGLRDVDPGERKFIEQLGISCFSMHEVDKFAIKDVVEKALSQVDPSGNRPIHVSFDVDAMDPIHAASTGTKVPGGLTLREAFYIAEEIAATGRLSVLDMVEVNPKLGSPEEKEVTVANTVSVTAKFYGSKRQGDVPPNYVIPRPQA